MVGLRGETMVQSEIELIKLSSLFQKVVYKWLDGSHYLGFSIEIENPHSSMFIGTHTLEVISHNDNGFPRCSVELRKQTSCPYDYWKMGVADYELSSSVRFYGRGKLLYDFKRISIGTQTEEWYHYVAEILAPINESQRFGLRFVLKEVLEEIEKELEFRKKIANGN